MKMLLPVEPSAPCMYMLRCGWMPCFILNAPVLSVVSTSALALPKAHGDSCSWGTRQQATLLFLMVPISLGRSDTYLAGLTAKLWRVEL